MRTKVGESPLLVGTSELIEDLRLEVQRVGRSDAKVLITGESGVGKEVVARAVHASGARSENEFVAVNCAGLPETLLESELFGHVKGSFTGAYRDKPGKLEMAHNGTVFLDEVGEMTLRMQGLLLRFLETGELQKVGSERSSSIVNVRVIAATNRNLRQLIDQGQFREDLFYRLNVIHLAIPPLRDRRADIPALIEHFLLKFGQKRHNSYNGNGNGNGNGANGNGEHKPSVTFAPDALQVLMEYSWPGNVRELENVMERLLVTVPGHVVTARDLPSELRSHRALSVRPKHERRRTVADDLYRKIVQDRESFWTAVYPLYMQREITRGNVRDLVRKGLEDARGNYKIVAKLFNMEPREYKRFLNFLRKHDCQLPFQEYRQ
jgi:transcriptional regulator with PAS, ATPase and Fis domain